MNPVVHFELPYEDRDRVSDFYTKAFGWAAQKLGPEMGDYVVAHTTQTDANNMVQKPGTINGGFFKKAAEHANPSVVIAVDDILAAMKKVSESGGTVLSGTKL